MSALPFRKLAAALLTFLLSSSILTGCGGGGGGGGTPAPQSSQPTTSTSPSEPADLVVGTTHNSSVSGYQNVYFRFTTGAKVASHEITLGEVTEKLAWTLYSDATYSNVVTGCSRSLSSFSCETGELDAETTYYLSVTNVSPDADSFTVLVSAIIDSEGTTDAPITVTPGVPYDGAVGAKLSYSSGESYYAFTTGDIPSSYTISVTGPTSDIKWAVYGDDPLYSGLGTFISDCDETWSVGDESCVTPSLAANTTYFLVVENYESQATLYTIDIEAGGTYSSTQVSDGNPNGPIPLVVGQSTAGSVSGNGMSYYQFTTGDVTATHQLKLDRVSISMDVLLYSDAQFTNEIDSCYNGGGGDISCNTIFLDPNTTYYMAVKDYSDAGDTYLVTVLQDALRDPDSEGTRISPIELTLGTVHSGTVGSGGTSRYAFTATEAKSYRISLTGGTSDLSWSTTFDWDQLGYDNYCQGNFDAGDEICETRRYDAGQTVYITVWDNDVAGPATYDLLVEAVDGAGEGTSATPVAITPGTQLLSSAGAHTRSYYEFTADAVAPTRYTVSVTQATSTVEWALVDPNDIYFKSDCTVTSPTTGVTCDTPVLEPGVTYRLEVNELDGVNTDYIIGVDPVLTEVLPVSGTFQVERTRAHTGFNYYQFTTGGSTSDYMITISNSDLPAANVSWSVYTDPSFSQRLFTCNSFGDGHEERCTLRGLAANTNYYLRTLLPKDYGTTPSYNLRLEQGNLDDGFEQAPTPIDLVTDATGTVSGSVAGSVADNSSSYYQFTTVNLSGKGNPYSFTYNGNSDVTMYLYDASWNQVYYCSSTGGTASCETSDAWGSPISLKENAVYYIEVAERDGYAQTFTLDVAPVQ